MSERFLRSAEPSSLAALIDRFFLSIDYYMIWIILILFILALVAYILKQMTLGGIVGAFCLGIVAILAFGFGGLTMYLFFVFGAGLLSHFNKNNEIYKEAKEVQEKAEKRDLLQVFANGGVGFILAVVYLVYPNPMILLMFGASVAEALSDTFSGEVGMLMQGKTFSILNGRPMKPGLSGGVSIEGTLGGLLGSLLIALMWYPIYFSPSISSISYIAIVTLSGFAGSIVDSLLGLTMQANYYDKEEDRIVEKEYKNGKKLPLVKGFRIIDNEKVNFISNIFSIILVSLFYIILL